MAVNEKNNVVLNGYQRGSTPVLEESVIRYLQDELQRIENSIRSLVVAGVEVLDEPPKTQSRGCSNITSALGMPWVMVQKVLFSTTATHG